ncbi:MAG: amidohydrolase, partial [Actinomycetia bacterium]|nr:amidohydrolase [Actinomycetes bacterium]
MAELTDSSLPVFLTDLGVPGIIDPHVHFMPDSVMQKVWAYFESGGELVGRSWPISYRTPEVQRIATLAELGVLRFGALSYAHKPGMAQWLSQWSLGFADRVPQALRCATFYPEVGVLDYVGEAIAANAELFKVHVQVGDFDLRDSHLDAVWGLLSDVQIPTVVHVGSGPIPGKFTGVEPLAALMRRHPRLPVIVAHFGVREEVEMLQLAQEYPSL